MEKRGGGINTIELRDLTDKIDGYYQLHCTFETLDAMGANFINSCLEQFAKTLKEQALLFEAFSEEEKNIEVVMSILSQMNRGVGVCMKMRIVTTPGTSHVGAVAMGFCSTVHHCCRSEDTVCRKYCS